MISLTKKFFIENKLFVKDKNYTHLLLDGGKVNIPPNYIKEFYGWYSKDILHNNKNYICEMKTNVFKLFMDLDFMYKGGIIEPEFIENVIEFINLIVSKVFVFEENNRCFICETEDKQVVKENVSQFKKGIHLVWSNVYVDKKTSIAFRTLLLKYIQTQEMFNETNLKEQGIQNDWDDIIDLTVFKANGLRMIKSCKMFPCSECNSNTNSNCQNKKCIELYNGMKRIDEGRPYSVTKILDENSNVVTQNFEYNIQNLEEISIRHHQQNLSKINDEFENFILTFQDPDNVKTKKIKKNVNVNTRTNEVKDTKTNDVITNEINIVFSDVNEFQNLSVLSICELSDETVTIQVDCRYCLNKKGFHNSNHIYFVVYKNTLAQKCYCTCADKTCKDYTSRKRKVSDTFIQLLLPNYYKTNIIPSGLLSFGYAETFEDKLKNFNKLIGKF